jgi:flavodoxin
MKQMRRLFLLFCIGCVFVPFLAYAQSIEKDELSIDKKSSAKALVVVYSYTGNTRAVADEIIERFKTDIVTIKALKYDGFAGSLKANNDAWNEVKNIDIKPETVDMSQYNLIFLGSPIWWYRPAVPLWTFVEKNSFKNKAVVLFNTFNSKFKLEYIEEFITLVKNKEGRFLDHVYVRRGRWYSQLSRQDLIEKFNIILDIKEEKFRLVISKGN